MIDFDRVIAHRDRVLAELAAEGRRDPRVRAVLLVGSLAADRSDAYSDIDVVLVAQDESADALLADRRAFPARFGEVLVQLDSSGNVWSEAAQVVTLLNGELPLWVDINIWAASAAGTPSDARVLYGRAPEPVAASLSDLVGEMKAAHGPGKAASENAAGAFDVARVAWRLKAIARGYDNGLSEIERALEQPWAAEFERAREPLRRFASHVAKGPAK
jgi:predicted nucleotidyltransferase